MGAVNADPAQVLAPLLAELARHGALLALDEGGQLSLSAPRGGLPAELLARVREHKALLQARLRDDAQAHATGALPVITPDLPGRREPFAPADLQAAFMVGDSEDMEYHVRPHYCVEHDGPALDPQRYQQALNAALERQRANLLVLGDDLRLHPLPRFEPVPLRVHDLRHLPLHEQQQALQATRSAMARRTLPLDRWPWFEVELSLHGDGRARLHWNHNNFFGDGYGTQRLMAEVQQRYHDPGAAWPELTLSYRDCVLALQRLEASALGERARRYWLQRLPGLPSPPPIPMRAGSNPRRRSQLQRRGLQLAAERWQRFKHSAAQHGLTAGNALFAVHAEVLARWSGTRHFTLNNMVTHRLPLHPQIDEVFGNFASLYPLEVDWREPGSFARRAQRLQQQVLRDLQHIHCSGVWVLQALNQAQKTPGRAPCPYVVGSGLFMQPAEPPGFSCLETPQVVLDHQFWALQDGRLWAVWDLIEDCFPPGLADAMWEAYGQLLARLADDPQAWHSAGFDLLPAVQRERRAAANRSHAPLPDGLLHDGLAYSAARWPGKTAVIDPQRTMDFATLHGQANRLAQALHAAGVQPGDRVGVLLGKGWRQLVAVFGVLRAGAVYVPLEPAWPRQRIEQVLDSVQARDVVCEAAAPDDPPLPPGLRAWHVDDAALQRWPDTAPPLRPAAGDLAYILFTSGSTGVPKGVMIEHRAALNTVADVLQRFAIGPADVVFGLSSLCFDLSVFDLFGTLAAGATLVLPGAGGEPDPAAWLAAMQAHGVTVWNSVPALMQLLADAAESAAATLPQLRTVMLSGDWIALSLPGRVAAFAPQARVASLGGATEAAIWSICHPIGRVDPAWPSIPYGLPMLNQRWHVLHDDGEDAPEGVPGHLCIAGSGLARGYWRDEAKTAAAFVAHPRSGERLYRTGDIGRYLPDGTIELIGRSDLQLKVQGHRIEPGEIEHALRLQAGVQDCVVLAHDAAAGAAAGRRLLAFVLRAAGSNVSAEALQQGLRKRLPAYMVPGAIRFIERLPMTATGKLDRQALQALAGGDTTEAATALPPRNAQEACMAEVWQQVLGLPAVGVHDDFFELGGTSFAALRAVTEIGRRLGRRVALAALLDGRTVAGLAQRIAQQSAWSPLVALNGQGRGTPWFLVHPSGGGVLCYRAMAAAMDAPVLGLQAPGLMGEQPVPGSIDEFARLYLAALRERQPQGPYRIGGWSAGGLIAFEIARQLERAGERVQQVLLLDTPAPLLHGSPTQALLDHWFDEDVGHDSSPQAAPADAMQPVRAVHAAITRAGRAYRPEGAALQAPVLLLRATQGSVPAFAGHPAEDLPDWGWGRFAAAGVRSRRVPGSHHTMLQPPALRQWLDELGGS